MTRHLFGGTIADWTVQPVDGVDGEDDIAQFVGGATITAWNAESGGTQYTDLLDESDTAVDHVTTSDGTDGRSVGTIPPFQGPDDIWAMWLSADGGPRLLSFTSDAASITGPLVDALNLALTAHTAAPNPHGTASLDLTDYSASIPLAGQVPVYDGERYVPTTVEGVDVDQFVQTAGGSTILIPEGNTDTAALQVRIPSGSRVGAVNTIRVFWNAGSAGSPSWVETFRVNPTGELVLQPGAIGRVPLEVRQFSGSQTANLTQWATSAGVALSFVDASGRVRAPNIGITPTWHIDTATVVTGEYRWYNPTGTTLTIRGFIANAGGQVPTGAALIFNPKLDGISIYTSGNRPTIPAGGRTSGLAATLATTAWPALSYLTVDVVQIGSTQAGTKITIQGLAY